MFEKQGGFWQVVSNFGGGIAFIGVFSFVLNLFNRDLRALELIDKWGPETGIGIRIGMIVIGAVIYILAKKKVEPT